MPTISAGDKVLVTGANGFVATWVVRRFLEKGYAVRGSVRSANKGIFLQELFKTYGDKFEIVVVEDITKEGVFDEAVKGVDGIAHTASPFYLNAASVDELIGPAVNGTVSILKSAAKHGKGIKRIVVTSSSTAVLELGKDKVYTEDDWNELAIREVKEQGDKASGSAKYCASKTLAEKAAWEFYEKSKSNVKWDLSCLNPPFVFGPVIHNIQSVDELNTSTRRWHDIVLLDGQPKELLVTQGGSWIDVHDVAEAHVLALEKEAAGGERILISPGKYHLRSPLPHTLTVAPGSFIWQDWLDAANSLSPSPIPSHTPLPKGYPGAGRAATPSDQYDTSKAEKILGLKYHSKEETARDTLADFERRKW